LLGDRIGQALKAIGITDERVSKLIGGPCNCKKRREYLNRLDLWARRVLAGKQEDARKYLDEILEDNIKRNKE